MWPLAAHLIACMPVIAFSWRQQHSAAHQTSISASQVSAALGCWLATVAHKHWLSSCTVECRISHFQLPCWPGHQESCIGLAADMLRKIINAWQGRLHDRDSMSQCVPQYHAVMLPVACLYCLTFSSVLTNGIFSKQNGLPIRESLGMIAVHAAQLLLLSSLKILEDLLQDLLQKRISTCMFPFRLRLLKLGDAWYFSNNVMEFACHG